MTQLGEYVGFPDESGFNSGMSSFVSAMGQSPTMSLVYVDSTQTPSEWVSDNQYFVNQWESTASLQNTIPVIGLPMGYTGQSSADASFQSIISGTWDSYYEQIFQAWANAGFKTLYIRPGWEMNGNWYPWSVTSSNAADFVSAFQHIATLAHDFTGANISVVWNPNTGGSLPMSEYYPGNQYVDVIGLDSYGSPVNSDNSPQAAGSSTDVELQSIAAFAQQQGKPLALPEVGAAPGDTAFPTNLAAELTALKTPISFIGMWDAGNGSQNLTWSTNSASDAAWKNAFAAINAITTSGSTTSSAGGTTGSGTSSSGGTSATGGSSGSGDPSGSGGSAGSGGSSGTGGATGNGGAGGSGSTTAPTPTPAIDKLVLNLSEDAWRGSAQFIVTVNGTQAGPAQQVTAQHGRGQTEAFTFSGDWGGPNAPLNVAVSFTNDAYGGTSHTDRNLYVGSITYDGRVYVENAALYSNGTKTFTV